MSDREFYKVFAGLIGALVSVTVIFLILAHVVVSGSNLSKKTSVSDQGDKAVAQRIKPIGEVTVGTTVMDGLISSANAAGAADKGKATFDTTCSVCHGAGVAGAPKFGDKAAWKDRIAKGKATLYQHALNGLQGKSGFMPPKGGNAALKDDDVKAAVDYMVSNGQ